MRYTTRAAAVIAAALSIGASSAQAATPQAIVDAQFRHAEIHRIMTAWDVPAADVTTGCLQRRARLWECGVVIWDPVTGPYGGIVDGTMTFRFTSAAGVAGYSGPTGPRWRTTLPYGRRAHRHLVGVVTRITLGKDRG